MISGGAPALFVGTALIAAAALMTLGMTAAWVAFAVTLVATLIAAVHRTIPRKER